MRWRCQPERGQHCGRQRQPLALDDCVYRAVANGLQPLLHAAGLNTITFTSGAACLDSLASMVPDCVVLDLVMPEPDGLTVQARLKAVGVTAPVIFISASHDLDRRRQTLAAGAFASLEKAVDEQVLLEAIASALRSGLEAAQGQASGLRSSHDGL